MNRHEAQQLKPSDPITNDHDGRERIATPDKAKRFMALFVGNERGHGTHGEPTQAPGTLKWEIKGTVRTVKEPVTLELWQQHLKGARPLGVIPIRTDSACYWGSIDIDKYGDNLLSVIEKVVKLKLPLVPCFSKSGGLHLWFFLAEPQPAAKVRAALKAFAAQLALDKGTEVFPKQDKAGDFGNWIIMPYFGSTYNGKLYEQKGVKKNGDVMGHDEFLEVAEAARLTTAQFVGLGSEEPKAKTKGTSSPGSLPRCLQERLDAGVSAFRNVMFFNLCVWAKKTQGDDWKRVAEELNQKHFLPPLDDVEMKSAFNSNDKKDYEYKRDEGGVCGECSCRTRAEALDIVCVADVPPKEIDWLWKGRIARGKLTIIGGHPGGGKSTLTIDLTARITRALNWPVDGERAPQGSVIMLTIEDDVADTIHPRLAAAGADVNKVYVVRAVNTDKGKRGFDLAADIQRLEREIERLGDVIAVVVDPLNAYMGKPGKIDSYRDTDMRSILLPLQEMAGRLSIAVLAITHLTKGGSHEALMRFLGSVGMVGAARAAYLVAKDKEHPSKRLFLPVKNNVGIDDTGYSYHIVEKPTGYDQPAYSVAVVWDDELTHITADEALAKDESDGRKSKPAETAKKLILDLLKNGPVPQPTIEAAMKEAGISRQSTRTAKEALNVKSQKLGKQGWWWTLPQHAQQELDPAWEAEDAPM